MLKDAFRKSCPLGRIVVSLLAIALATATSSRAQDEKRTARALYAVDRQKTRDAYERKDDKALREALLQLHKDFSGRSAVPEELAGVEARLGNNEAALDWLRRTAEMGLVPLPDGPAAQAVKLAGTVKDLQKKFDDNRAPVSGSAIVFRFSSSDLLTEDIAYDAESKKFLISSVRQRKIMSCDMRGACEDFVTAADTAFRPLWGVFALQIDPSRRYLWATTGSTPFESGHAKTKRGVAHC